MPIYSKNLNLSNRFHLVNNKANTIDVCDFIAIVYCRERSERLYNKDHSISMVYPVAHAPCVNNSRTGWVGGVGRGGEGCKSFVTELLPDD